MTLSLDSGVALPQEAKRRLHRVSVSIIRVFVLGLLISSFSVSDARESRHITAIDLANIRDIGGHHYGAISVSPDGEYVAFQLQTPKIDRRDFDLIWYVAETKLDGQCWSVGDGGSVILNPQQRATTNGNRPPVNAAWTPDGKWIIYLKKIDGEIQIWRSGLDGNTQEQLTRNAADILSFTISDRGDTIYFSVAEDRSSIQEQLLEEGDQGFLFDDRFTPNKRTLPIALNCANAADGQINEISNTRACGPPLWVYEFTNKIERRATTDEIDAYRALSSVELPGLENRDVQLVRWTADDGTISWLENEEPKRYPGATAPRRLFASISGNEFRCEAAECGGYGGAIEDVWLRQGNAEIVFQRAGGSNKAMTGLYAWTPSSGEVRHVLKTDDLLQDCAVFASRAICLREQWRRPRTIVSIDLDDGAIETIFDPNPEFEQIEFTQIEKIEWEDEFGNSTHGHLVYPANYENGRRYPLVITTYRSRGFLRGGVGDEYPIHLLAAKGFMVLSHDMPRSYERTAAKADSHLAQIEDLYERRSSLSAQERIIELLNQRGLIDPRRVAITGLSDGADQVRFALIHTNLFAAAIASSVFDYGAHYGLSNKTWRAYWRRLFGGSPEEDGNGSWHAVSFDNNTERVQAPLLINVSDSELLPSVETFGRLQDAELPVEMYVFPGEYHIKWQPQHRLAIYRRNVQWLQFWLKGEEVDDPIDPEQYKRWRELRKLHEANLAVKNSVPVAVDQ